MKYGGKYGGDGGAGHRTENQLRQQPKLFIWFVQHPVPKYTWY